MKVAALVMLAIAGCTIAAEENQASVRDTNRVPRKDNRNLVYVHNVPLAKSLEDVRREHAAFQ
ncbi:hypothetical protein AAL_08157 [Moelleriella libera RCEF 2490]|uniref:RxLR effector protein n=1 Tax=Moelleriella libera RCEF 2490 TaxID=1081109 RepID=A0A167VYC6_9HYPO|nr:hypothetical protein AAL_08157 [Moelleriella libera RCEF 2490]